jgi:hypothetical protein
MTFLCNLDTLHIDMDRDGVFTIRCKISIYSGKLVTKLANPCVSILWASEIRRL